ncbi:hypothetical protein DL93DRAFT_2231193 [Clavulina sp. PMI_390]|nr:hypothetical protein DL93DRAFT_2231193 [Clavulina sp. PMI_390]
MQSEYAGSREPRPLRRRSISSPRVAPFSPFTPSLTYRSPLISHGPSSSTNTIVEPQPHATPANDFLFSGDRNYAINSQPRAQTSRSWLTFGNGLTTSSRFGKSTLAIGLLLLWATTWYLMGNTTGQHRVLDVGSDPRQQSTYNVSTPYYASYLTPKRDISSTRLKHTALQDEEILPRPLNIPLAILPDELTSLTHSTSLSIILPCPSTDIVSSLPRILYSLITRHISGNGAQNHPTIFICPNSSSARLALRIISKFTLRDETFVRVAHLEPSQHDDEAKKKSRMDLSVMHAAARVGTDWVLVLDEEGVEKLSLSVITLLHHPPPAVFRELEVPFGPRGVVLSPGGAKCISKPMGGGVGGSGGGSSPALAAFLVPPFVVRRSMLLRAEQTLDYRQRMGVWAALGLRFAMMAPLGGGMAPAFQNDNFSWDSRGGGGDSAEGSTGLRYEDFDAAGGLVVGWDRPDVAEGWCPAALQEAVTTRTSNGSHKTDINAGDAPSRQESSLYNSFHRIDKRQFVPWASLNTYGTIVVLLPSFDELVAFSPALCRSARLPHALHILVYGESFAHDGLGSSSFDLLDGCHLHFDSLSDHQAQAPIDSHSSTTEDTGYTSLEGWLRSKALGCDVILAVAHHEVARKVVELGVLEMDEWRHPPLAKPEIVWLPAEELGYMEWTGMLGVEEWKHWHVPTIDLVIITNDRPASLARLLRSVRSAIYLGDSVSLHINVEQTADPWTQDQVRGFATVWEAKHGRGKLSVRHRVILGGLLPAIVESWYPSGNDSYGLLLEDDVEVSPMFYAWAKMNVLKYRYGSEAPYSERLFGISLYQQKSIELRPHGREPFSASTLFSSVSHSSYLPTTPYLSQIPCSWGAVYFPQHWSAFHEFIIDRLSERTHPISTHIIAPFDRIRSNRWSRSWKKFFNEYAFLHGLVMLYPNFEGWTALSTNHLEVGVHVHVHSRGKGKRSSTIGDSTAGTTTTTEEEREFERKRAQFALPLMELPYPPTFSSETLGYLTQLGRRDESEPDRRGSSPLQHRKISLVDLPDEQLPRWADLPVLDLWGYFSNEEEIIRRGVERYEELMAECGDTGSSPDKPFNHRHMPLCRDTLLRHGEHEVNAGLDQSPGMDGIYDGTKTIGNNVERDEEPASNDP